MLQEPSGMPRGASETTPPGLSMSTEWWENQLKGAPIGAEPALIKDRLDQVSSNVTPGSCAHSIGPTGNDFINAALLLPRGIDDEVILAAYALVLARATAFPEPYRIWETYRHRRSSYAAWQNLAYAYCGACRRIMPIF